jgi:hypothetical protein
MRAKSPDELGLFGPLPPGENISPHSCGPIGEAPFGALLIWAWKLLRKLLPHTPPPPDILCCYTEPLQKLGAVLAFTQHFGHKDLFNEKFIKNFRKSLDKAFLQFLKFKIIFTNNKVAAL